jgi:hypothetical protein
LEIRKKDIVDGEQGGKFETESKIVLAVALVDFNGVVDVVDEDRVVGYVVDAAGAAAALQIF